MKMMSFIVLGIAGTIAYQRINEHKPMLQKELRRMMRHNNKSMKKIVEIF